MTWLWIVLGVIVVGAGILIIVGLRAPTAADPLESRLAEFAESGKPVTLDQIELSQPFYERVLYPIARRLGEFSLRFTPQNAIQDISVKLERAGSPAGIDPTLFFAFRLLGLGLG
jgi:tight adherence protein C